MRRLEGQSFSNRFFGPVLLVLLGVFIFISIEDSGQEGERYLLKEGGPITVSMETQESQSGWTPLLLDIQGLIFCFKMDVEGRVFGPCPNVSAYEGPINQASPLFLLDTDRAEIKTEAWTVSGELFAHDPDRLIYRFDRLSASLILDVERGAAALDLKGLVIPVPVLFGPEADGVRELGIGDRRELCPGCLCLDTRKKQLFWAPSGYAGRRDDSARITWAVS